MFREDICKHEAVIRDIKKVIACGRKNAKAWLNECIDVAFYVSPCNFSPLMISTISKIRLRLVYLCIYRHGLVDMGNVVSR